MAVLGAIALCLFPLWPEVVRLGVYYLSLAAASFVGFILLLVIGTSSSHSCPHPLFNTIPYSINLDLKKKFLWGGLFYKKMS